MGPGGELIPNGGGSFKGVRIEVGEKQLSSHVSFHSSGSESVYFIPLCISTGWLVAAWHSSTCPRGALMMLKEQVRDSQASFPPPASPHSNLTVGAIASVTAFL